MQTWILVANSSRAILYRAEPMKSGLAKIREFEHPESRMKGIELVSDGGHRTRTDIPDSRAGMDEPDPKEAHWLLFARELADALREGRERNEVDSVVLVAPPQFLGMLRGALHHSVSAMVRGDVVKDYTRLTPEALRDRLVEELKLEVPEQKRSHDVFRSAGHP